MALYPCDFEHHWYPGPQRAFYVAYGKAQDFRRWKLRLCGVHAADIHEYLAEFELGTVENTARRPGAYVTYCLACREPVGEVGWQVYVTGYPAKDERKDYWAGIHPDCRLPEVLLEPAYDTA